MRIATLILGIFMVIIMLFQSCAVSCLGSVSDSLSNKTQPGDLTTGGAMGIAAAFCGIVGVAFVLKVPIVSIIAFLLGALFAGAGPQYGYKDGAVWMWALILLAALSLFGQIGLRKEKRKRDIASAPQE